MSVNSSLNSSLHPPPADCHDNIFVLSSVFVSYILLLLLFILVLHVGFQRWRKRRSVAAASSHSDIFTLHMAALEMIGVLGASLICCGIYTKLPLVKEAGQQISASVSSGQTLFHLLTCVERYLAVVHPVTYLRLRQAGGVRIRNISVGCVWATCFAALTPYVITKFIWVSGILSFSLLVFSLFGVSFFSLSGLRVLIRPGPGEVGRDRVRVDQSKQRAFFTIMAIMVALVLRFLSTVISLVIYVLALLDQCESYLLLAVACCSLPSSLVLPLLFLHRAAKLPGR